MDKFSMLEQELENIIARLNKKIETKSEKAKVLNSKTDEEIEELKNLNALLKSYNTKKNYLKEIEGKNIILYVIKKEIAALDFEIIKKEIIKGPKIYFSLFLIVFLASLAFIFYSNPLIGMVLLSLISVFGLWFLSPQIISTYHFKKKYSLVDLTKKIKGLETKKKTLRKEIKKHKVQSTTIRNEITTLEDEKIYYEQALEEITTIKDQIIEKSALNILNAAFNENRFSDIIKKVREKNQVLREVKYE